MKNSTMMNDELLNDDEKFYNDENELLNDEGKFYNQKSRNMMVPKNEFRHHKKIITRPKSSKDPFLKKCRL